MRHRRRCCGFFLGALAGLLLPATARAQDAALQKRINNAIDRGVAFLEKLQREDGYWVYPAFGAGDDPSHTIGATALCAWTLLECGVPGDDPHVARAAAALRRAAITETKVYNASLMIFFFDKLGDPQDVPFIESLAVRLLAAQTRDGGWAYFHPGAPSQGEQDRLTAVLHNRREPTGSFRPQRPTRPRDPSQLPPEIQRQLEPLLRAPGQANAPSASSDNSNTQFALLALWVARRYGLPVERSLAVLEHRFREYQAADGSWYYNSGNPQRPGILGSSRRPGMHSPAMTCAGLLGLAVGHANDQNKLRTRDLLQDAQVRAGLAYLGRTLPRPGAFDNRFFYFLWSLERMAVIYDLKRIGDIDWYPWGARYLVERQAGNGSWTGGAYTAGGVDTCFALLFLKRANVAYDLKLKLPGPNLVQEPPRTPKARKRPPIDLPIIIPDEPPKAKGGGKEKSDRPNQSSWEPGDPAGTNRPARMRRPWPTTVRRLTAAPPMPTPASPARLW
jgi:hypothetical protein